MYVGLAVVLLVVFFLSASLKVLNEYERGVIFRLGRIIAAKGPGLIILIPIIDRIVKVSLRLVALDVDPQDVITRDNVSVKVNAVLYFRVVDPVKAIVQVENYAYAMSQLAQTTLRSVCGQAELDDLLAPGASRSPPSNSNKSICPRRCSGPLPGRPKPSASGAPRSSTPRASSRRPPSSRKPPASSKTTRSPCSCATCRP
jgi:hypothetical protein